MGLFSKIFGKKEAPIVLDPADLSVLKVDMHGHYLHGIDDGAQDISMSEEMLTWMEAKGYQKIIATPHVMHDFYRNSTETILSKRDELRQLIKSKGLSLELDACAEYYFDEELQKRLKSGDVLSFGKEQFILFEFSYFNEHSGVQEVLFEMQSKGYTPLLAHPERYPYMAMKPESYLELHEMGVKFQVNLMSFANRYGEGALQTAEFLAEKDVVDFIGTDIHRPEHFGFIEKASRHPAVHKLLSSDRLINPTL